MRKSLKTVIVAVSTLMILNLTGCAESNKPITTAETGIHEEVVSSDTEDTDTEDATTVTSTTEDEDTSDTISSGHTTTTESHRDDGSDTPSNPRTTETTTEEPSAPSEPGHSHNWEPVYSTRMVQQYADDGTTNDYSKPITEEKPIYEDRPVYEESPIYETHAFNNGVDVTVAIRNYNAAHGTNFEYGDRCLNMDLNIYLNNLGATSGRVYSDQVQVGTERVQVGTERVQTGTETVTVGYEQLGKKEEKYISGYICSCGKTK